MEAYLSEWLSLIIRWIHVIVGIAWIGASFYFVWLDNHLTEPPAWKKNKGIKGDLWAIHGGGFYEIAKYQLGPEAMPKELHWFKWEAYSTWLSGTAMLFAVYYFGNPGYLIDPTKADLSALQAMAIGLGTLAGVMVIYESLIRSPLSRNGLAFGAVLYGILVAVAWGLFQVFAGRGAFIHVGAVIGTIMVANVFLGIIPAQKALVDTVRREQTPDARVTLLAERAKLRSTHNNYLTLPILLIMISNHYPMLYGNENGWMVLAAIGFITAFVRHFFNLRHRNVTKPSILIIGAALTAALIWVMVPATVTKPPMNAESDRVSDQFVDNLITIHCQACHVSHPTNPAFQAPPAGISLASLDLLKQHKDKVYQAAVATHYMPLGNTTGITDEERSKLGQWLLQQGTAKAK